MIRRPVIINGMFRSGTTLLWRILAADATFSSRFCEPLHLDLLNIIKRYDHYREYLRFPEVMRKWSPDFHSKKIRLDARDKYRELEDYISLIMKNRSLTKFVRMNLRIAWLLEKFPNVFVVNIIRDPRAICYSFLKNQDRPIHSPDISWTNWYASEYFRLYSKVKGWKRYLKALKQEAPYIKILALWKVNVEQSTADLAKLGDSNWISLKYEDLIRDPEMAVRQIYIAWGEKVPPEVIDNACGREVCDLGGHNRKWQTKTNDKWVFEWKKIPYEIWERGILVSGISQTMEKMGYDQIFEESMRKERHSMEGL